LCWLDSIPGWRKDGEKEQILILTLFSFFLNNKFPIFLMHFALGAGLHCAPAALKAEKREMTANTFV